MNTKYSIKKVWYYLLCMIMTLQLIACTEETHESYTAAPEVEDIYIDQLEELISRRTRNMEKRKGNILQRVVPS